VDIATVSVLSSTSVALATVGAGLYQHHRGLAHQRKLADLENVRGVLDDAAALLHRTAYELDRVRFEVGAHGAAFFRDEGRTEVYERLGRCGEEADALTERVAVRLGREQPAVKAFAETNEAALAIYRALGSLRLYVEPPPDPGHGAAQVRRLVDEKRVEIETRRGDFDRRRDVFMSAAQLTAGAQLPAAD
jgi:hypothetical protein